MNRNILDICICSGSTNDKFIWRHSDLRRHMLDLRNDQEIIQTEGKYYFLGMYLNIYFTITYIYTIQKYYIAFSIFISLFTI